MSKFSVDDIKGVVPPIATPINKNETVDEAGMRRLVKFLLGNGANCIFVMGGTGEFFCLSDKEKGAPSRLLSTKSMDRLQLLQVSLSSVHVEPSRTPESPKRLVQTSWRHCLLSSSGWAKTG